MSSPLLAVDVGNSRIKFGLFDCADLAADLTRLPECRKFTAVRHDDPLPWDDVIAWTSARDRGSVASVIAGTNPDGVQYVAAAWPAELSQQPTILDDRAAFPIDVSLDEPHKVGTDRLLNAIAANVIRPAGAAAIIIDSGTATTVDLVAPDGAFAGGAILPGIELSAKALRRYTALLPLVPRDELTEAPADGIGKNTRDAIRSGLLWGHVGAMKELIARLANSAAGTGEPLILLTGGAAPLLAPLLPEAHHEPALPLQGLALAARHSLNWAGPDAEPTQGPTG